MHAQSLSPVLDAEPGFIQALDIFNRAALQVPAYAEFLSDHKIDASSIRTLDDFAAVPAMTKENYLRKYPLAMLMWHGDAAGAGTWSTSSGSTGRPTYWPRDLVSHDDAVELYARIFRHIFQSHRRSTLVVNGFAMGNWIGGTYTYAAVLGLRRRGHKLSVIAPGIDVKAILDNVATLAPHYDQVVLCGYPPFVKDVLDRAPAEVLRHDIRLLLAGENVTEAWRDYVLDRIGKPDRAADTCLIYGTADAGVIGHETRTTIAARRLAAKDSRLGAALFGDSAAQPTFVEYDADRRFTEVDDRGRFLFTVDTAIPLVRYRINDEGSTMSAAELADTLRTHDHQVPVFGSTESCRYLVLHRRSDVAATFYAVKIYPDSIRAAVEHPTVATALSGKFVLSVESDEQFRQTLNLRVELRSDAAPSEDLADRVHALVVAALDRTSTEYRRLHQTLGASAEPVVQPAGFGSAGFAQATKHRWTGQAR